MYMIIFTNTLIQRWFTHHNDIGTIYSFFFELPSGLPELFFGWNHLTSISLYSFLISISLILNILVLGFIFRFKIVKTHYLIHV